MVADWVMEVERVEFWSMALRMALVKSKPWGSEEAVEGEVNSLMVGKGRKKRKRGRGKKREMKSVGGGGGGGRMTVFKTRAGEREKKLTIYRTDRKEDYGVGWNVLVPRLTRTRDSKILSNTGTVKGNDI